MYGGVKVLYVHVAIQLTFKTIFKTYTKADIGLVMKFCICICIFLVFLCSVLHFCIFSAPHTVVALLLMHIYFCFIKNESINGSGRPKLVRTTDNIAVVQDLICS